MAVSFSMAELKAELNALGHHDIPEQVILDFLSQLQLPAPPDASIASPSSSFLTTAFRSNNPDDNRQEEDDGECSTKPLSSPTQSSEQRQTTTPCEQENPDTKNGTDNGGQEETAESFVRSSAEDHQETANKVLPEYPVLRWLSDDYVNNKAAKLSQNPAIKSKFSKKTNRNSKTDNCWINTGKNAKCSERCYVPVHESPKREQIQQESGKQLHKSNTNVSLQVENTRNCEKKTYLDEEESVQKVMKICSEPESGYSIRERYERWKSSSPVSFVNSNKDGSKSKSDILQNEEGDKESEEGHRQSACSRSSNESKQSSRDAESLSSCQDTRSQSSLLSGRCSSTSRKAGSGGGVAFRRGKIDRVARFAEMQRIWKKDSFLKVEEGKRKSQSFYRQFSTTHISKEQECARAKLIERQRAKEMTPILDESTYKLTPRMHPSGTM